MNNKKLSNAKQYLAGAIADLESAIVDKINEVKYVSDSNAGADRNNQAAMNNLHNEINILQKTLAELGAENEKLRKFKSETGEVVNQIKIDLVQIKKIIANPNN